MDDGINDLWTLYFHDPYDTDWTYSSYVRICDISDINTFKNISHYLDNNLSKGMFFIFREGIFPSWDDESNINGGFLSFKILKKESLNFWLDICSKLLLDEIVSDMDSLDIYDINGVSISPKKDFCIFKLWFKTNNKENLKFINISEKHKKNSIYKTNLEKIDDHNRN